MGLNGPISRAVADMLIAAQKRDGIASCWRFATSTGTAMSGYGCGLMCSG